jgi:glycyl-tRNA synthetase beta chain
MQNFIFELGTEELPPKSLKELAQTLKSLIESRLIKAELDFESIDWYASPRRLSLSVKQLIEQQPAKFVEKKGPSVQAAFDNNGNPTKAAEGWARSNGITVSEAERLITDKGEWLMYRSHIPGKTVHELLPSMLEESLKKLPIAKPMRWGNHTIEFIRPVHSVTMMYGNKQVPGTIFGLKSSNVISGHRFLGQKTIQLNHADDYLKRLKNEGYVIADFEERKQVIADAIASLSMKVGGTTPLDNDLLEEVTAITEWPCAYTASFDQKFLQVPSEALIATMKSDQKYFPVFDQQGKLTSQFIFVSNIETSKPDSIISGNEKVIRPRLADAEFFYKNDQSTTLEQKLEKLRKVTFQKDLGSMYQRSQRIASISQSLAEMLNTNSEDAYQAGLLSKADLMSEMVLEFTDTQGYMGMHYALQEGKSHEVSLAISEQYLPKYSGDRLPTQPISIGLALAEKLDTLIGIFGVNLQPKSDKDPFALRRSAIGLLRIIIENKLDLDLNDLILNALKAYEPNHKLRNSQVKDEVLNFVQDRYNAYYKDLGISSDVILSVNKLKITLPYDYHKRITAVYEFKQLNGVKSLIAINKRVNNILKKNQDLVDLEHIIDRELFVEPEERILHQAMEESHKRMLTSLQKKSYQQALEEILSIDHALDTYFEKVMIMSDQTDVRKNRLAVLVSIRSMLSQVADLSEIQL